VSLSMQLEPWQAGLAVRRDWPDGTHEFVRLTLRPAEVARFVDHGAAYWRTGPMSPRHSVVAISRREFDWHRRRDCRSLDCPAAHERDDIG
jgi:hypothetical protein